MIKTSYQFFKRAKKGRKTGECFYLKIGETKLILGLIIRNSLNWYPIKEMPLLLFFKTEYDNLEKIGTAEILAIVNAHSKLLIPPTITNELGWTKGYYKTFNFIDIEKVSFLHDIRLYNSEHGIVDITGVKNLQVNNLFLLGIQPLKSCYAIEVLLRISLNLPFIETPPERYNPYSYLNSVLAKNNNLEIPFWYINAKEMLGK